MSRVPEELTLTLEPGMVTLIMLQAPPLHLSLDGTKREFSLEQVAISATADWTSKGLEVDRRTEAGGGVVDLFSVDDGGRLIMKREVDLRGRGAVKATLVYTRQG